MALFARNTPETITVSKPAPPTLTERTDLANRAAVAALSQFEVAAQSLEHSAIELEAVDVEATKEAEHYMLVAQDAADAAKIRRTQAANIRQLLG